MKRCYDYTLSQKPLLLHGTNILAILELFETGYLPPSQKKGLKGKFHFAYTRRCSQSRGLRERGYRKGEAIATAKFYARNNGIECFLDYLSYPLKDHQDLVPQKRNYCYFLKEDYGLSPQEAKEVVAKIFALRGVIIEPSDAIFDFRYFTGDDFNNIAFHFPRGMHWSLIRSVFPLGEVERKVIAEGKRKALHELLV